MDQDLNTIEEAFENIPEEVKRYIYSASFRESFNSICSKYSISNKNSNVLKNSIYSYIAQIETEEELLVSINSVSNDIETNQKIIDWVKENVIEKALEIVTNAYLNEEEEVVEKNTMSYPEKPSFSNIEERLSQSKIITPSKRDYSVEKINTPQQETPKATSVDPYRELPEK